MVVLQFPPPELADESGLLAIGGDLEVETLLLAYRSGIFPWPFSEDGYIPWFSPPQRALLFFDRLHISKRLSRIKANSDFAFKINTCFPQVIENCAKSKNRTGQQGTWITKEMISAYTRLHEAGYCHSIECFSGSNLVGGLYGVSIGQMFAGESMFYLEPNASKLSLLFLAEYLTKKGLKWMDCQQMTPLLSSLGAIDVPRDQFLKLLSTALSQENQTFK